MSMLLLKHVSDLNFWHASMYMYVKQLLVCSGKKNYSQTCPCGHLFLFCSDFALTILPKHGTRKTGFRQVNLMNEFV